MDLTRLADPSRKAVTCPSSRAAFPWYMGLDLGSGTAPLVVIAAAAIRGPLKVHLRYICPLTWLYPTREEDGHPRQRKADVRAATHWSGGRDGIVFRLGR